MSERINKDTLITRVSQQTGHDVEIVTTIIDAFLDEIYHTLHKARASRSKTLVIFLSVPGLKAGYLNLTHLKNGVLYLAGPPRIKSNQEKLNAGLSMGFRPQSGGKKITPTIQGVVEKRIRKVADENFQGHYTRLDIRFRGQFCYIDAYTEPKTSEKLAARRLARNT